MTRRPFPTFVGSLLLLISLIPGASPAAGQAPPRGPVASVLLSSGARGPLLVAWASEPHDSVVRDIRPTYWKEGALVGGLLGAVGGALLGAAVCESGKICYVGAAVGGALLLTIPGALIGGQFPKGGRTDGRTAGQAD